ncbi:hypothetical protein ONZ45_g14854 [Pleurotus djamor]|nr:hypothetical protein ONZ45_g14854 [Pleurotus djamor]
MRIVATFFQPGATKELSLDEIVRDTVVRDLVLNTHPDVFLPAYEEVYELVERTSLPRFLAFSTANINRPKQLFWYFCGVLHILGSLAVAITLIRMLPDTPSRNRAWRLFSLPWAWFGSMQLFAASRGFCNQVWSRNGVQLHSWELSESDEESRHFVERVITDSEIPCSDEKAPNHDRQTTLRPSSFLRHPPSSMYSQSTLHANTVSSHGHGDVYAPPSLDEPLVSYTAPTLHDAASTLDSKTISLVAPFLNATSDPDSSPHGHNNHTGRNDQTTRDDNKYDHASKLPRPPIFGPERVVQDHRIKAVHRQTMNAIWLVGFVYVVVSILVLWLGF